MIRFPILSVKSRGVPGRNLPEPLARMEASATWGVELPLRLAESPIAPKGAADGKVVNGVRRGGTGEAPSPRSAAPSPILGAGRERFESPSSHRSERGVRSRADREPEGSRSARD